MVNREWIGSDHEIESVEQVLIIVQPPVGENVGLDALENAEVAERRVERIDLVVLRNDLIGRQSSGIERRLRVVGDADVAPAAVARRSRHVADRRLAIGVHRVTVQHAADVAGGNETGERAGRGGLHLTGAFAKLNLDDRQLSRGVDVRFLGAGNHLRAMRRAARHPPR